MARDEQWGLDAQALSRSIDSLQKASKLLRECQKVLQCHARHETKDLRERISRFRKEVPHG